VTKNQAVCGAKECKEGSLPDLGAFFPISAVHGHFDTPFDIGIYVNRRMLQRSNSAQSCRQEARPARAAGNNR
jgi:hypothetical protein